jgi:hypothetical protein
MPGDDQNFSTFIASPHEVINALAECIKSFGPLDKPPSLESKPRQDISPSVVKEPTKKDL